MAKQIINQSQAQTTKLGYSSINTNFSTASTTAVQVTSLTTVVTMPSGGRSFKITMSADYFTNNTANNYAVMTIWDGVVGSGTLLGGVTTQVSIISQPTPLNRCIIVTPTAGSKTYNIGLNALGGGTASITASSTGPAFILVELT